MKCEDQTAEPVNHNFCYVKYLRFSVCGWKMRMHAVECLCRFTITLVRIVCSANIAVVRLCY